MDFPFFPLLILCFNTFTFPVDATSQDKDSRKFLVSSEKKILMRDGQPFTYVSGSIHYFRVLPDDWRDRLRKLRYSGCNAVQTYVEWSSHEPEPGEYNFERGLDLISFIKIAQEENLFVILRPGPYICAERDMGGLPYWLLRKNPKMALRTSDPDYQFYVGRWFGVLLPKLIPLLYNNGGPIIMIQIENEYGSYPACDFRHTSYLRDITNDLLGSNIQLFTTDGWMTSYLKCGKIPEVYATVDFGAETNVDKAFSSQRLFEPDGPLINSEYYPGWLDHWGESHETRSTQDIVKSLDAMLSRNASVNIYVFHGGTNFGLSSGANYNGKYKPCPTSYDYDAPLTEAGDPTDKYFAMREIIKKYLPVPIGPPPSPSKKYSYGDVPLHFEGNVLQLSGILENIETKWPLTFEELYVQNGLVVYSTKIPYQIPDPARLSLFDLHDRGYIFMDSRFVGVLAREKKLTEIPIYGQPNQTLTIVVESQGRIGYGKKINELKGITANVTIDYKILSNWKIAVIPMNSTSLDHAIGLLHQTTLGKPLTQPLGRMSIYDGQFQVDNALMDTFLKFDGWTKGYIWINGFLLGRYWPVMGPQITLYVPNSLLLKGINKIRVMELEKSPCNDISTCKVSFVDTPIINGPIPEWN